MDEYQLEIYCQRHPLCDCNCIKCPGFGANQRHELGLDECDDDDYETYCLQQEIMETACDDIGF